MKKKSILGVMLTLVLLGSLLAAAVPVSAGTLSWTTETIPGTTGKVLESGGEVTDLAVYNESIIYAGTGNLTRGLYKTTNRGVSWTAIATTNNTDLVAVASDDSNYIAYVDTTSVKVYVSTNGGSTWGALGTPQETDGTAASAIHDIAISAASAGIRYLAVAGEEAGPFANVWYYNIGAAVPSWTETNDKTGFEATGVGNSTAAAVAFSPNFPSDQVLVALTGNWVGATDTVSLELYSFNQSKWNDDAGFAGYAAAVISTTTAITDITKGALTLAPDYNGSDDSLRLAYVGVTLAGDTASNGLYRMADTAVKALKTGATIQLNSVAYNGSNLVAGRYDSNIVYYSGDPTAGTPTVSTASSLKRPGGDTNTIVAWAGADVVAGTRGNENAFAVSRDNGKTFNDISLIDTALTNITDVVVSADGSTVYMATDDATDFSLWRKASAWERVLSVQAKAGFIIRTAPDDSDVVYAADLASDQIYYSADAGETRWQLRTSRYTVADIAVEGSGDTVYVLVGADGKVSKSTNAGFTWASSKTSELSSGNMILSLGAGNVLVGSNDGYVAYSTDGASTFTKISKQVGDSATEVVLTASGLADGDYIYAAVEAESKGIYRWQIGTSAAWKVLHSDIVDTAFGAALQDGVLYVLAANTTAGDSTLYRTLSPTVSIPSNAYFSTVTSTATLNAEPQGLRVSSGSSKLWAVNSESTDSLYSLTDTLATAVPTLASPADDTTVKVNKITGYAHDITFSWNKPSDEVTAYDLKIYDAAGAQVLSVSVSSSLSSPTQVVGKDISGAQFTFMPGETYSWKVRVSSSGPVYSGYSETREFSVVEETVTPPVVITQAPPAPPAPTPTITIQAPPAPNVTVQPPAVTVNPAPAPAAPVTQITPAWIYAIIIVGAVLVIAVIVLIVRTRRVV